MYLTETSAPTRGRSTEDYLDTVLLHKSPRRDVQLQLLWTPSGHVVSVVWTQRLKNCALSDSFTFPSNSAWYQFLIIEF
jgi:hypothetical protein